MSGYVWGLLAASLCLAICGILSPYLRLSELVMISLLGVVAVSTRFGIGPSLFTAAVTALTFDFFFIPPVFALGSADLEGTITVLVMSAVATVISGLGERSRREQAATRSRDLQIQAERLRSSLLSAVSHDLRTPLAAIFGAGTELLQDGARLDETERRALVSSIVEESSRLNQLVTNLLEVARFETGSVELRKRPEPVDEVFEAALGRLQGRLIDRDVRTTVPESIPMVPMDAVLVEQVLVNLLENAIRYTPAGSPLELEASDANGVVTIELRDRGPGIQEAEKERLFERFHRGADPKPRDGGVGLGLTICRAIVEAHGGTIAIANRAGGGATVSFTLPCAPTGSAS
jgi:two-component system, OmpR family, sensor histidine kinase KdpD